jgi:hypothetical protein
VLILATIMHRIIIWLHQFISNHNVISEHKAIKQNQNKFKKKMSENKINSRKNPTVICCLQIMAEPQPATARILDISVPGQLGTWRFRYWLGHLGTRYWTFRYWPGHLSTRHWTVRDLDETIFGTDYNCLVLINWQYFCTSSSLIFGPKVDRYVFLIIPV